MNMNCDVVATEASGGSPRAQWPALRRPPQLRQGSPVFAPCGNHMLAAGCPQDVGLVLGEAVLLHRGQLPNRNIAVAAEGWVSLSCRGDSGSVVQHPLHTCSVIQSAQSHTRNHSILKATTFYRDVSQRLNDSPRGKYTRKGLRRPSEIKSYRVFN